MVTLSWVWSTMRPSRSPGERRVLRRRETRNDSSTSTRSSEKTGMSKQILRLLDIASNRPVILEAEKSMPAGGREEKVYN